jgi:hypothetical protein
VAKQGSELENLWWQYAINSPFYTEIKKEFEKNIFDLTLNENLALKTYYGIALKWLQIEDRQKKMESYFLTNNIRTIAIYGLNTFQEILCQDLEYSHIKIAYIIDSYATGYAYGYEVKSGGHFEDIDAIVVATSAHFQEIRSHLSDVRPVISLYEVVKAVYQI